MHDDFYFDLLEFLYANGIKNWADITDVLRKKYPDNIGYGIFDRMAQVEQLLSSVQKDGYINFKITPVYSEIPQSMMPLGYSVTACITIDGFQFLNDVKRDKSILDTNLIIREQSKNQTIILIGALLISVFSALISWLNYNATNDKSAQKQYLLPSKELIRILKRDTTSPKIETYRPTRATKTSPKN